MFYVFNLFPLDGSRRLGGDVVDDTVDVIDFVDDAVRDTLQHIPWDACPVGCHTVNGGNGADADGVVNRVNYYSIIALFSYINCSWYNSYFQH